MTQIEIILLGLALSIDACIASFAYGLNFNQNRIKNCLLLAFFTGIFQGLMPCLGFYLTSFVKSYIEPYTPIIVCVLFVTIGIGIIRESLKERPMVPNCIGVLCLFLIGIATSMDAFSAGISLALYEVNIAKAAVLFTTITCINSSIGFCLGGKLKAIPRKKLEISAGLILIGLGIIALF